MVQFNLIVDNVPMVSLLGVQVSSGGLVQWSSIPRSGSHVCEVTSDIAIEAAVDAHVQFVAVPVTVGPITVTSLCLYNTKEA